MTTDNAIYYAVGDACRAYRDAVQAYDAACAPLMGLSGGFADNLRRAAPDVQAAIWRTQKVMLRADIARSCALQAYTLRFGFEYGGV